MWYSIYIKGRKDLIISIFTIYRTLNSDYMIICKLNGPMSACLLQYIACDFPISIKMKKNDFATTRISNHIFVVVVVVVDVYLCCTKTGNIKYLFSHFHQCNMKEEGPWGSLDLILLYFVKVITK